VVRTASQVCFTLFFVFGVSLNCCHDTFIFGDFCITYQSPPLFGLLMLRKACRQANSTGVPGWLGQVAGSRLHGAKRYVIQFRRVVRLLCNDLFSRWEFLLGPRHCVNLGGCALQCPCRFLTFFSIPFYFLFEAFIDNNT
jgi:hypothetical protein